MKHTLLFEHSERMIYSNIAYPLQKASHGETMQNVYGKL